MAIRSLFKKRFTLILLAIVLCITGMYTFIINAHPNFTFRTNISFKEKLNKLKPGLVSYDIFYQDNRILSPSKTPDYNSDIKEVQLKNDKKTLINYLDGYSVSFPQDTSFDFTVSALYTNAQFANVKVVMSRECSAYAEGDTLRYINEYPNRFMTDPTYIKENHLTIYKNDIVQIGNKQVLLVAFERNPSNGSQVKNNAYIFAYILGEKQTFFRLMFNNDTYSDELMESVTSIISSFDFSLKPLGRGSFDTNYTPKIPSNWSNETKAVYQKICGLSKPIMGVYLPRIVLFNYMDKVETLQKELDYNFGVVMDYMNFLDVFPVKGMTNAYNQGKIVELTVQTGINFDGTNGLNGYNNNWEIYDGKKDEDIRKLARKAKEFGKPFLMRLNNEMNSDWTCYGAPAMINDPEIYKAIWRKFYNIFQEEGVNNAIWIFNPNDRNYPPCNYNHFIAYYPGDEYVQMFGITGYNTGDYYKEVANEQWRSFKTIYDSINEHCMPFFDKFPWIITEFSTSSYGGDKPGWIRDALQHFTDYKNIKLAVWFNHGDMDYRPGKEGVVARPYYLDENLECIQAFKDAAIKFGYKDSKLSLFK